MGVVRLDPLDLSEFLDEIKQTYGDSVYNEVINYKELVECGSHAKAREKGLIRIEGKDYVVQDGDVILFRFNV